MVKHFILNINWSHAWCIVGGALWNWIEPTLPFALLCVFAVMVDCISAWRLNRRIRLKYGPKAADGKLKSHHMMKMVSDLFMLFAVMLIAQGVNDFIPINIPFSLGNCMAAMFLTITLVSILENESSQNGSGWARLAQKFVADKTYRHLINELSEMSKEEKKPRGRKPRARKAQTKTKE